MMPWCPNCKEEYEKEIKVCSECGEKLVDELPIIKPIEYVTPEFLVTARDNIEANNIESILSSQQIPVIKKYREAGNYLTIYMGATNFGVDIYVPAEYLEVANDILYSIKPNENIIYDEEAKLLENKHKYKQRIFTWIILLFFIPGILTSLIFIAIVLVNMLSPT